MKSIFLSGWGVSPNCFRYILPDNCLLLDTTKLISKFKTSEKISGYIIEIIGKEPTDIIAWSTGTIPVLSILDNRYINSVKLFAPTVSFLTRENVLGVSPRDLRALKISLKRNRLATMANFFSNCSLDNTIDYSSDYSDNELLLGLEFLKNEIANIPVNRAVLPEIFASKTDKIIPNTSVENVANILKTSVKYIDGGHSAIFNYYGG